MKNDLGLTPLSLAIECGGSEVFKLLVELYLHIESCNANSKVLSKALTIKDDSALKEPPLIKAIRKDRTDIVNSMLLINKEKYLKYDEVLCLTDEAGKNALHHAVIK